MTRKRIPEYDPQRLARIIDQQYLQALAKPPWPLSDKQDLLKKNQIERQELERWGLVKMSGCIIRNMNEPLELGLYSVVEEYSAAPWVVVRLKDSAISRLKPIYWQSRKPVVAVELIYRPQHNFIHGSAIVDAADLGPIDCLRNRVARQCLLSERYYTNEFGAFYSTFAIERIRLSKLNAARPEIESAANEKPKLIYCYVCGQRFSKPGSRRTVCLPCSDLRTDQRAALMQRYCQKCGAVFTLNSSAPRQFFCAKHQE